MAGIYLHIPYCKKACHYCNFHFSTTKYNLPQMVTAIANEAALRKNDVDEQVETIYFGGGTPSILSVGELGLILNSIKENYSVAEGAEITLEANPDDIDETKLAAWKLLGINRLSIGVQSFFEEDLVWMNRAHNAGQAENAIVLAQKFGFNNITIDLIYGTPTLTDEKWKANVDKALALGVPHLSCYALTVEPKTALDKMIALHKVPAVDMEKQSRHFDMLMAWVANAGFEHYEISNFAKPGFRSRHNSSYWQNKPYVGLGPSAHSFNGKERQWNVANNNLYLKSLELNELPFEMEILTPENRTNEYIMTSLRTMEGLDLDKIPAHILPAILAEANVFFAEGKLKRTANKLVLTNAGKHFADGIAAAFFV